MPASYTPLHLEWPDCVNVRDLGGLPTHDGGAIRPGALIRADSLTRLTTESVAQVRRAGVSRILDLRRPVEGLLAHPFAQDPAYVNIPVEDPADPKALAATILDLYREMLRVRPDLFAAAIAAIADAPRGAVVVHCAAGKDRTGLVVALALSVAGVAPERIAEDYGHTGARIGAEVERHLQSVTDDRRRAWIRSMQVTSAATMLAVLRLLEAEHGSVEDYLRSGGLTEDQLVSVRARLVVPGSAS